MLLSLRCELLTSLMSGVVEIEAEKKINNSVLALSDSNNQKQSQSMRTPLNKKIRKCYIFGGRDNPCIEQTYIVNY